MNFNKNNAHRHYRFVKRLSPAKVTFKEGENTFKSIENKHGYRLNLKTVTNPRGELRPWRRDEKKNKRIKLTFHITNVFSKCIYVIIWIAVLVFTYVRQVISLRSFRRSTTQSRAIMVWRPEQGIFYYGIIELFRWTIWRQKNFKLFKVQALLTPTTNFYKE